MIDKKILFLGKKNDLNSRIAVDFLSNNFTDLTIFYGEWGDPFPEDLVFWDGDLMISYLSRWKIPEVLIDNVDLCINFHPGSNEYPGIGCLNFALYNNENTYGVCCHHISKNIDAGEIISVDTFPILATDNVKSLIEKTYAYQLVQFYKIMDCILKGEKLPQTSIRWKRKPYKRREFEKLKIITLGMNGDEVARRIRATSYGEFQPKVAIGEFLFDYSPK